VPEKEQIAATHAALGGPVTIPRLVADLRGLGVQDGDVLLVHTALSRVGWIAGGAQALILALQEAVGSHGLIAMPAQSGHLSDPAEWENPPVPEAWWPIIRDEQPPYDPRLSATRGLGVVPEVFRSMPDVLRSDHPHDSFTAWGAGAQALLADHVLGEGFSEKSPLGRLLTHEAKILMLATDWESCTALHLAEALAQVCPPKRAGATMTTPEGPRWVWFEEPDHDGDDFAKLGAAFEAEAAGAVRTGQVGLAPSRLLPMRALIDFAVPWLQANRPGSLTAG